MPKKQTPWVEGLTFAEVLAKTVDNSGDREAAVFSQFGYRSTWAEFEHEVRRVARALISAGVQQGDHVGIWATNLPEWVLVQFATALVGAPLVNINPAYRAHELQYVLKQADITALVLTDRFKHSDYFAILTEVVPEVATEGSSSLASPAATPKLRRVIGLRPSELPRVLGWASFLDAASQTPERDLDARIEQTSANQVVNIQYTSGTTGFPKGVQLTHRNLLMNAFLVGQRMEISRGDRVCIPVPFYHCFGCVMGTLMCTVFGATMVVPTEVFDPLATLDSLSRERCTAVYGVPTMFIAALDHPQFDSFDLSQLRTGIMAGSPCPMEIMNRVVADMGAHGMTIAYGLTEASPVITQTATSDTIERRVSTVGTPLPGLEVRIVDPGSDTEVPTGVQGELIVRGHGVMKGYYNMPEETALAITPEGWLHSGDLATRDEENFYRITGRIKDMIIRGGENVYPREIEEFLYTHPAVSDVQVVGVPDARYGEEISAWIKVRDGHSVSEEEIREYCVSRIAHFKVPRYFFFVESYPCTVTGKVQKFKLRELAIGRLGLSR